MTRIRVFLAISRGVCVFYKLHEIGLDTKNLARFGGSADFERPRAITRAPRKRVVGRRNHSESSEPCPKRGRPATPGRLHLYEGDSDGRTGFHGQSQRAEGKGVSGIVSGRVNTGEACGGEWARAEDGG